MDADEVRDRAVEIAANNMRKLVPPVQRARLAELRLKEALDLGNKADGVSLRQGLEAVHFEMNQAPTGAATMSLAEFLLLEFPKRGGTMSAEWLAGTPRQALDLCEILARFRSQAFGNETKDERDDRMIVTLFEEIRRQIREEWRLPYTQRERLADMLKTSVTLSFDLETHLRIEQGLAREVVLREFEHGTLLRFAPTTTHVFVPTGREADPYQQPSRQEPRLELHRRLAAGMLLAHDLVAALWGGYLRHSPLTYRAEVGPRVVSAWGTGNDGDPRVDWPRPEWWTFRDFERFAQHWSLHADQCEGQYGFAWLAALLEVALNEACKPGQSGLTQRRLADFLATLVKEQPSRTARRLLRQSGLAAVALLLAPESMSNLELKDFDDRKIGFIDAISKDSEIQERIRHARTRSFSAVTRRERLNTPQGAALCAAIAPTLAWRRVIEMERRAFSFTSTFAKELGSKVHQVFDLKILPDEHNSAILEVFRSIRSVISDNESLQYLLTRIGLLIMLTEYLAKEHKSNKLKEGAFVPTEGDIERIR